MLVNKLNELRKGSEEEGFTLIELMIVVVIIGILAAIAIPIFANQQKSAIAAGVKSDVKNTNTAVATALVKKPTATGITSAQTAAGADVTVTIATGNTFTQRVSDSKTELAVSGDWNNYTVIGKNASADAQYTYSASSGKMAEAAYPAAPVTP